MQRIAERMPVRAGRIVSKFMTFTLCASSLMACGGGAVPNELQAQVTTMNQDFSPVGMDTITLGAGCFWCVEAVFVELKGVASVTSGYMGGHVKDPSYSEVCTGNTGHAEVARLVYDPKVISFDEILEVFWQTHDPTTLNRQVVWVARNQEFALVTVRAFAVQNAIRLAAFVQHAAKVEEGRICTGPYYFSLSAKTFRNLSSFGRMTIWQ